MLVDEHADVLREALRLLAGELMEVEVLGLVEQRPNPPTDEEVLELSPA